MYETQALKPVLVKFIHGVLTTQGVRRRGTLASALAQYARPTGALLHTPHRAASWGLCAFRSKDTGFTRVKPGMRTGVVLASGFLCIVFAVVIRNMYQLGKLPAVPGETQSQIESLSSPLRYVDLVREHERRARAYAEAQNGNKPVKHAKLAGLDAFPSTDHWPCAHRDITRNTPTVFMLSGFIASGKSSLARVLRDAHDAVIFSPDEWIVELFGRSFPVERFQDVGDLVKDLIWTSARELLGLHRRSVVLDFSLWTRNDRDFWRQRILQDASSWFQHCPHKDDSVEQVLTSEEEEEDGHSTTRCVKYQCDHSTPPVKVELIFVTCPRHIARDRLIKRNAEIEDLLEQGVRERFLTEEAVRMDETQMHEQTSLRRDNPKPVSHVSLPVPLDLFDEWYELLEPAHEDEQPFTIRECNLE